MKKRTSSLPLLVIVAVLALVVGSFGTAVAGPALTKSQVKKIAKKQAKKVVNQMAPTLSVAFAANAGNSSLLNGQPATTYLDRVAFTSTTTATAFGGSLSNTVLGPVNLTVPAGVNFVHLEGAATAVGGNFGLYWAVDAACTSAGPEFAAAQYTVATAQGNASFHVVLPATAGVHNYRLCANNAAATFIARSIVAETVQGGNTGGTTLSKAGQSAPVKPGALGEAPR